MTRFATTAAIAAFVALGTVAANAADVQNAGLLIPNGSIAAETGKVAVRAGDAYSARELAVAGLNETDVVEFEPRAQTQVRAGDVHSSLELIVSGLNADDLVSVSNFADSTSNPSNNTRGGSNAYR